LITLQILKMKKSFIVSVIVNVLLVFFIGFKMFNKPDKMDEEKVEAIKQEARMSTLRQVFGNYHKAKVSIFEVMPNDSNEIIFLGNSITDYCDWNELFGNQRIKNRGISADFLSGVIERIDEVTESHPEKIFMMIGINDLQKGRSVNQILTDYKQLINLIKEKSPETKLYIQSLLPTKRPHLNNADIIEINKGLKLFAEKYDLTYIDLFDPFKTENNQMNMDYSFEGLHPNGKGYLVWKNAVEEYVNE